MGNTESTSTTKTRAQPFFCESDEVNEFKYSLLNIKHNSSTTSGFFLSIHALKLQGILTNNVVINQKTIDEGLIGISILLHNAVSIHIACFHPTYIFTSPFLGVTFIALPQDSIDLLSKYSVKFLQYVPFTPKSIISVSLLDHTLEGKVILSRGTILTSWGFEIHHNCFTSTHSNGFPIFDRTTSNLVAVQKGSLNDHFMGVWLPDIVQAIVKHQEVVAQNHAWTREKQGELIGMGLEQQVHFDIERWVSPASVFVTPIWFRRTNHGWYWTPTSHFDK
eukprot:TRINITY_DN4184_c0_g2_i1.p1 TRINITY_DN4184_c0_g2~~TRINITY_DN4184_c0_g2_i1.p1  ORF type:complete len:278 (+),score=31.84 TRINITY_DN4184_c0_g2_i1:81-914(+)